MLTDRLDTQGRTLELLARRQQVLAANIANADTPGYQARDIDFASALARVRAGTSDGADAPLQWRQPDQPSLDGNTVDLDRERANFADNALRYEAGLSDVNAKIKGLLAVIQGN